MFSPSQVTLLDSLLVSVTLSPPCRGRPPVSCDVLGRVGESQVVLSPVGWSVQVPSRQATERDETKIAAWKDEQWPS